MRSAPVTSRPRPNRGRQRRASVAKRSPLHAGLDGAGGRTRACDDDGLRNAIVNGLPVGMDEELDEAKAAFQSGSAVAQGSLETMPEGEVAVDQGDDPDVEEPLSESLATTEVRDEAEVEHECEKAPEPVEGVEMDDEVAGWVLAAVRQRRRKTAKNDKDEDDSQVEHKGPGASPKGGEWSALELRCARYPEGAIGRISGGGEE